MRSWVYINPKSIDDQVAAWVQCEIEDGGDWYAVSDKALFIDILRITDFAVMQSTWRLHP